MKRAALTSGRVMIAAPVIWETAALCSRLHANRSIASMVLLLEVLTVAALGDRILAVFASIVASMALSWYFIDTIGSLRITSVEGWVTFSALLIPALVGSQLAVRARRRTDEAHRRREEMERLQMLGQTLLVSSTWREAAEAAVSGIVRLFGVRGAALLGPGESEVVIRAGSAQSSGETFEVELDSVGDRFVLELRGVQPSREARRAMGQLVGLALDRARQTEERAHREGIRRGEELRGMVLDSLAHHFRTPLTSIKAASSALCSAAYVPEGPGRELVQVIDEEADRLDRLIGGSLNLADIESRCANPRITECSLAEITEHVMARVGQYITGRQITVKFDEPMPAIAGDPELLERMLFEVIDNAWKYSRPGSRIEIVAIAVHNRVLLTVRSHGNEILPDERELIFDKFYRGTVRRSQVEGTGLGLAIVRAIANAHHGFAWVDAESGGQAFRFSLPAVNNGVNASD